MSWKTEDATTGLPGGSRLTPIIRFSRPKRAIKMTDDLGYEMGELTPFMKGIGLALMGLNVVLTLTGWFYAGS